MTGNISNEQTEQDKVQEFDIVWLIAYIWAKRKLIAYIIGGCLVFSIVLYFALPRKFTASAAILPITKGSSGSLGDLKSLASLAGVNIGSETGGSATITPDLYTEVVTSTPALLDIMENVPLTWVNPTDTVMTLYEYMKADTIPSVGQTIMKYTIMLPFTIKNALSDKGEKVEFVYEVDSDDFANVPKPIILDKPRKNAIEWLKDRIVVMPDEEVNLVRISAEGECPAQCAQLAAAVMKQIQTTITEYATSNAKKDLNFLEKRYEDMMVEFTEARQEFFDYRDRNRDYVEERSSIQRQKLEDKYNLSYSLLQSLQSEVEKSRMRLLAETPVFSIVEPVVQPTKKTSPKLLVHLLGGFFVGFVCSIGGLLLVLGYKQVFKPREFKVIYDKYRIDDEVDE
ncbi:MAG: Wzz/FepE/Etk N-terminal domain-containing protein [Bacteroidales bacterium]|nr:Wzz/FepE/Etk N-terminal domain-containing protein [Bacteroidales bacterium]MDY4175313.1 Wzz/FepE/Etk N-terminal domain-containing protein [Bacteroidales bacterium]